MFRAELGANKEIKELNKLEYLEYLKYVLNAICQIELH